jgi:alkylhydroperoxidase/carboxymuconolactone decarboxylase family protein YurZ
MKEEVFFGERMANVKKDYPDLYNAIVGLNEAIYTGKTLDYRTQKLIALGINAAASDDRATKKQMISAMKEFHITKDDCSKSGSLDIRNAPIYQGHENTV